MLQKLRKRNEKGFTLIELMIVIAIIGILAAIAIPNFISYRKRVYNSAANADTKNIYTSAQAYYTDFPAGTPTRANLVNYGFRQTSDVTVAVTSATQGAFATTAWHASGNKTFTVDFQGAITP
jgi:prepilin-type N-terminal cleavage/methylation domain-containing protein